MLRFHRITAVVSLVLLQSACASAGDRLQDGIKAEGAGRYYEAAMRFVEALEKDETLVEARDRLMISGDSAVVQGLRDMNTRLDRQNPVGAAEEILSLDRLLAAAQDVQVSLPVPVDYSQTGRAVFDQAISGLMATSLEMREASEWNRGRRALARLRSDFRPDAEQRRASFEAEAWLLLDWAVAEEDLGRFRRAFGLATEALELDLAPQDVVDRAASLQQRALKFGTRLVAVFPITKVSALDVAGEEDPALLLSDLLELQHWRQPPAFIAVSDPVILRRLTRRYTPRGTALRPAPILAELEADFGVLIEVERLTRSERRQRQERRTASTRDGGTATFLEESGTQRYDIRARVIIVDQRGREIDDFVVSRNESGSFERGVYDGDLRDLNLSRNQRRLFDPVRQAQVRAALEEQVITELSRRLGRQAFERLLRRIP